MSASVALRQVRFAGSVLMRFAARRTVWGALLWGGLFGLIVATSAIGYKTAYPTALDRQYVVTQLGHNPGLSALFGTATHLDAVGGFTAWRVLGVATIIGGIWGLLTATKLFRGEEEQGRWELFLIGRTTARRAALNAFLGFGVAAFAGLLLAWGITAAVGSSSDAQFGVGESALMAVAMLASGIEFFAVGALVSQFMPTRGRAIAVSAILLSLSFVVRALADSVNDGSWLLNFTPLGWIEKLHPLTDNQVQWLVPIAGFVLVVGAIAVYLAGLRDAGAGLIADKDTGKPHTRWLGSVLGLGLRQSRGVIAGWIGAVAAITFTFGAIAKAAGDALSSSQSAEQITSRILHAGSQGAKIYLGIVFMLVMAMLMILTASFVNAMRHDEAEGYLDNIVVRPQSRLRWLIDRLIIIVLTVVLCGLASGLFAWIGTVTQQTDIDFGTLLQAGVNAMVPSAVILGIGVLFLGFWPRRAGLAMYVALAGSFLLELIGSVVNLDERILDISILHHVALAPAADPNWHDARVLLAIGLACTLLGMWRFVHRDLQSE